MEHLQPLDVVIDATCGNGHDTLFLTTLSEQVISLDIQRSAIQKTEQLVGTKATLLHLSHEYIDEVPLPKPPRLIVYNLGYLPGGDKCITTKRDTTLISLKKSMNILAPDGAISLTCYPGHEEGFHEEQAVAEFLKTLNPQQWTILQYRCMNRLHSPIFYWIEKVG